MQLLLIIIAIDFLLLLAMYHFAGQVVRRRHFAQAVPDPELAPVDDLYRRRRGGVGLTASSGSALDRPSRTTAPANAQAPAGPGSAVPDADDDHGDGPIESRPFGDKEGGNDNDGGGCQ
jgi:hypothetical protein